MAKNKKNEIDAIKVSQWLDEWNDVKYNNKEHRRKPSKYFYLFSLPASTLKSLSGIQRRTTRGGLLRSKDLGIERLHDEKRSKEIKEYIKYGYPWSEISKKKRTTLDYENLRKPGWLPTAIVVNLLTIKDVRKGIKVDENDIITIKENKDTNIVTLKLPASFKKKKWKPKNWPPIEIIDGQHRLWAFDEKDINEDFELPVVAFHGLDISWQAYLFWTINIKPKRINPSFAFDLYPLLRTEDWLEKGDTLSIYRENRAQELVEAIWACELSPWYHHINMLGERRLSRRMPTQAAWIRSLMATYIKQWNPRRGLVGGLFGSKIGNIQTVVPWTRAQQAAFIIVIGQLLKKEIEISNADWINELRNNSNETENKDLAFYGPHTLLNTDQGIRGILYITNDICYLKADKVKFEDWITDKTAPATDMTIVESEIKNLKKEKPIVNLIKQIIKSIILFDWRSSSAPGLSHDEKVKKTVFRGSSGYRIIRFELLMTVMKSDKKFKELLIDLRESLEKK